jgi:hypothetical protein
MKILQPLYVLLALSVVCVACDGPVDRFTDCAQVCDRYSECFDDSYDVDECTNACDENAADTEDADARLDRCESCLDDRACAESVFPCSADCVGIIP